MAHLMGIDIGTTSTRTIIIDEAGVLKASVSFEYPLSTPQPGWAEQDPEDWWQATLKGVPAALAQAGLKGKDVDAIGLSGQMHGSVFLDEKGQVVRPCILWCDHRTQEQCEYITETVGRERLVGITCNPVLTGFTAPKIVWLMQNEPHHYERVRKITLPKDFIRLRLTGECATEVSDASGTSLLDVPKRDWSDTILERLGLERGMLPAVYESPVVSGRITRAVAEQTGLAAGTPVVGGGGDQAAGGVGNGIVGPGLISSTTGTSGVVFAYMDEPLVDKQLRTHTFCHAVPGKWHVMGVMLSAGGSFRWLRDALGAQEQAVAAEGGRDPYAVLAEEAATAEPGCEGLIFLPYLAGERAPYADPNARGAFVGLSLRHHKRHLVRAVLEGVAYGLKDCLEIVVGMGVSADRVRASGGGARSPLWRQIQADVTGMPHEIINVDEGPAFGVALLAGVGAGIFSSVKEACAATIRTVQVVDPDPAKTELYRRYHRIYQNLYTALRERFADLAQVVAEGRQGTQGA